MHPHAGVRQYYQAHDVLDSRQYRHQSGRPKRKLLLETSRFELIPHLLKRYLFLDQIAGQLKNIDIPFITRDAYYKKHLQRYLCVPVGQLRHELIHYLRRVLSQRKPQTDGVDRRDQIPERICIHLCPPEVDKLIILGHWKGDLIRGKDNASAVDMLVELTSGDM